MAAASTLTLDRLNGFQRFVERIVELAILRDPAPQNRLEIRKIRDVHDQIDTSHKSAHGVVGGELVAQEDEEMLPPLCSGPFYHRAQDRVVLWAGTFEILV